MSFLAGRKILVTGGKGFLGHHVVDALKNVESAEVSVSSSKEFNLTKEQDVERLFNSVQPDVVFHLAGLVGGILPNKERPAEFFYQNLMMGTFMLHYAWKHRVRKFVAAGAGCGYPEFAPIPLKETDFWSGFPQKESAPYSLAKRLLTIQSAAYQQQYGFVSIICIPGNIYGEWDNFNLLDAHVVPALVRKFVEVKLNDAPSIEIWGSGEPTRDFVHAADVAKGMVKAAEFYQKSEVVNISSGVETSVREICKHLCELTGYQGEIRWNTSRPDGQKRRCFNIDKARRDLGFKPETDIRTGLERTVRWYQENLDNQLVRR
jgi:GDP-L-fucose synthase